MLIAALIVGLLVPSPTASVPGPRIINVMPTFLALYGTGSATASRAQRFRTEILGRYPEAYDQGQRSINDVALSRYLASMEPLLPALRSISEALQNDAPSDVRRFAAAFPDFDRAFKIYLMPSLGFFDGTVRDAGNEPGVLLGVDEFARMGSTPRKLDVVVTHEFVHLYQGERNPGFQSVLNMP